jgi:hypothetical protein
VVYYFWDWVGSIIKVIFGGCFTKKPFMALEKWKMSFSLIENENFLKQNCLKFQVVQFWRIWDHLNKLFHDCGHDIGYLAWKSWIFIDDSYFLKTSFQNICNIQGFLFFLQNRSHIMTQCERIIYLLLFFEFLMSISKCG